MAEEELSDSTFASYPYDVALSYVVEDYQYAHSLAEALRELGTGVYNDEYQQPLKERARLYAHLTDLYENKAPYRVVLLSRHYVSQADLEQEIAHTLVLGKDSSTISIRLDDVDISGIPGSISCLDGGHRKQIDKLGRKIIQATSKGSLRHSSRKVPPGGSSGLKTSNDWVSIGRGHYKARRFKEASAAFDEALKINPTSEEARIWKRRLKELGY